MAVSGTALMRQRAGGAKRGPVYTIRTVAAPIGGLNARDSIAEMKQTDAIALDNFVPGNSNVALRPGYRSWATGIPGNVESILPYRSGAGEKMFAAAAGKIYDSTALGVVGAAVVSGLASTRFQYVNFGTPGGQFLLAVNGADKLQRFDGLNWTDAAATPAITGFDTTLATSINAFGQRIWLVEKNSFRVWYLPLQAIGGGATSLDLSSLFRLGGSLAGMLTWTVASTQATTQYAIFVSTQGEVVIFEGYDPQNAATWALVGQARIGKPIGSRFWTRVGTDVVLICADGFVPLSEVLQLDRKSNVDAVSNKIENASKQVIDLYGTNFGWQVCLYPSGNRLIVNVPQVEEGASFQFVMNTKTNAWCRYLGITAFCWEETQDSLFFGGVGGVFQAEYGSDDNGTAIVGVMMPAFSYMGDQGFQKHFKQVRVVTEASAAVVTASAEIVTNFDTFSLSSTPQLIRGAETSPWDSSNWDVTPWGEETRIGHDWQWLGGMGFCATLRLKVNLLGTGLAVDAISYAFERGGLY